MTAAVDIRRRQLAAPAAPVFQGQDLQALVERLRAEARGESEACRTITLARYGPNYEYQTPEQTQRWKAADAIQELATALAASADALAREHLRRQRAEEALREREDKGAVRGMARAAAILMRGSGREAEAREILAAAGLTTMARMRECGVATYDAWALRRPLRNMHR